MNPWICALLITTAGAIGGSVNALMADKGFYMPRLKKGIICPGFLGNILIGALSAFASWSFYGSGASVELGITTNKDIRNEISLKFSALAGAFLVGVAGAKWLSNETDKKLLKEGVREASKKNITSPVCDKILQQKPLDILESLEKMT